MANRYVKMWSTSLIIREIKIKTPMRYYLTTVKMAVTKMTRNYKSWQGCGEREMLVYCQWKCKLVQPQKHYGGSFKN